MKTELTEAQARVEELTAFEIAFNTLVPNDYVTAGGDSGSGGLVRGSKRLVSAPDNLTLDQGQFNDGGAVVFARYYGNTAEYWAPREAIIQELRDYIAKRERDGQAITQAQAESWMANNSACGGTPLYQLVLGLEPRLQTKDEFIQSYLAPCRQRLTDNLKRAQVRAERTAHQQPDTTPQYRCSRCGVLIPRGQAMSASLGTACPDCYDALSD